MFRSLFTRRGGVAVAAATIGAASLSLAFAGPAGAAPSATAMIGSGSQTSYAVMTGLTDLFNGVPGCDLTAPTAQPLTLNCGFSPFTAGSPSGEQGFTVAADNPYNDYTVQAPPIGSGNGVLALQGSTQFISYARSSSHKGGTQQNDVQYATDGVSWTTFSAVAGAKTTQAKVTNITLANLIAIWNGTLTCTVKGVSYTENWICVGAKTASPIDVYVAQTGSGTYSTWQGALGFSKTSPGGVTNPGVEAGWVANGGSPATLVSAHENLFENDMSFISKQVDAKDAIYFFSLGKFSTTCPGTKGGFCAGTPAKSLTTFGAINGIVASQTTVQGTGGGGGVTFPVTRGLYNIYNNSTATAPAGAVNQATLNFAGENGFLCKSSTASEIDPQTGATYRSEIEKAITSNGFFPLDVGGTKFAQGSVPAPGTITDAGYAANDNAAGNTGVTGQGFCLVTPGA